MRKVSIGEFLEGVVEMDSHSIGIHGAFWRYELLGRDHNIRRSQAPYIL